jgi:membrane-bound inhibitor of C-type lysozyme
MTTLGLRPLPLIAALGVPLAFAGCQLSGDGGDLFNIGGDDDRTVEYRCDDDRRLRVDYNSDRDRATVEAGDDTYRLRLEDRDGGQRRYGDGDVQLTVDGDEARLRIAGGSDYSDCRER